MRFSYAVALEAFSLVLTFEVLVILAADITGRVVTSADGMAGTVLCVATMLQCFRTILLGRLATSSTRSDRDVMMLSFSGTYLIVVWAMLHIGISIMQPSRSVFTMVGVLWNNSMLKRAK